MARLFNVKFSSINFEQDLSKVLELFAHGRTDNDFNRRS
jgi:hypothetical protein